MKRTSLMGALALAAASLFSDGCTYTETKFREQNSAHGGLNCGIGFDAANYDVNLGKLETEPVKMFESGLVEDKDTVHYITSGNGVLSPKIKLEGFWGNNDRRLGFVAEANYRNVIYSTERPGERYGGMVPGGMPSTDFVQLTQGVTYIPSIFVKKTLPKHLLIGIEVGFPYTEFEARTGYDKWDRGRWYKQFSWRGFGRVFGANIGIYDSGIDESLSLSVRQESYNPALGVENARIYSLVWSLDIRHDF